MNSDGVGGGDGTVLVLCRNRRTPPSNRRDQSLRDSFHRLIANVHLFELSVTLLGRSRVFEARLTFNAVFFLDIKKI